MLGKRGKEPDEIDAEPSASPGPGGQVSVIAKGTRVLGDCECDGEIRVEGTVTGSLRAPRVLVSESGSVTGDVAPVKDGGVFSVAGRVGGSVRGAEVEVRRGGSVVGPIVADRAVIHGRVGGGIVVRDRLALEGTAVVEGDIEARRLAIKEGGQFDGKIRMAEPPPVERPKTTPAADAATTPLAEPLAGRSA
ncbi:MAG: polymer-forming cytoskeletal protein [Gemmatimonadales bacterium]